MTWHTATVRRSDLVRLLQRIRGLGGTITCSRPETDGVHVTWTTADDGQADDVA